MAASLRELQKSSTTPADMARIWLEILAIFFPIDQGFSHVQALSTSARVLLLVQRGRDHDGDTIVDDEPRPSLLVVDCRKSEGSDRYEMEIDYTGNSSVADISSRFGVIACGPQLVFLDHVSLVDANDMNGSLHGIETARHNLIKACGRDATETWLCHVHDHS